MTGQLAGMQGDIGTRLAGLGQLGQQMQYTDIDALSKLGKQKYDIDAAKATTQDQFNLSNI